MKFENEFEVRAPAEQVYEALLDVERVAPCMPGAEVIERVGDDAYQVGIKVKLGPIAMTYRGQVEIVEKEPEARRAVMKVRARETRGQGMADATAAMSLQEDGELTRGRIEADVQLSGKAASMGRGVIQDVSAALVTTFADNLAAMLSDGAAPDAGDAGADQPPAGDEQAAAGRASDAAARPAEQALPIGAVALSVAKGRLRDPRMAASALVLALLALLLVRRVRR